MSITAINQAQEVNSAYEMSEWEARQRFVSAIGEACEAQDVELEWMSQQWIARLERGDASCYLEGYLFPLNSVVSSHLIRDKVSTATVLQREGVPVIPHRLLRLSSLRDIEGMAERAVELAEPPLVIKPCTSGGGGVDVMRCTTMSEVQGAIGELSKRHRTFAISPFVQIDKEFRTVVLDNEPLLTFEKVRAPLAEDGSGEWRHNLKLGAVPELQTDPSTCRSLGDIATEAMNAVRGRFAIVDTAQTSAGDLQVLEMNGVVTFSRFSAYSSEYAALSRAVYAEAIERSLALPVS